MNALDVFARWRDRAACYGRGALFDPPGGFQHPRDTWPALDVCASCPVRIECRTWVLGLGQREDPGGICGGLTEQQRHAARTRATEPHYCSRCKRWKPGAEFYPDITSSTGLRTACGNCCRADRRRRAKQGVA